MLALRLALTTARARRANNLASRALRAAGATGVGQLRPDPSAAARTPEGNQMARRVHG
jgi:hypothetical protein